MTARSADCSRQTIHTKINQSFKYYRICNYEKLKTIVGINDSKDFILQKVKKVALNDVRNFKEIRDKLLISQTTNWNAFTLNSHPGLIVIQHAFSKKGSMIWAKRCLEEYTKCPPHCTNISNLKKNLNSKSELDKNWWSEVKYDLAQENYTKKCKEMRWATVGYHHDWDSKVYSEDKKSPMDSDVQEMCRMFLTAVSDPHAENFKAEAAIVNFYPPKSFLSPHTDHSERFLEAPLLSFSFGSSGVFLIGGLDRNVEPTVLCLNHGDVLIMSKESRLCFHALPRILSADEMEKLKNSLVEKGEMEKNVEEMRKMKINVEETKVKNKDVDGMGELDSNVEEMREINKRVKERKETISNVEEVKNSVKERKETKNNVEQIRNNLDENIEIKNSVEIMINMVSNDNESSEPTKEIDSLQNNEVDSLQKNEVDSLQNNKVDSLQNNEADSLQNNEVDSLQNNEVDSLQNNEVDSLQNNEVDSLQNNEADSLQNNEVDSLQITAIENYLKRFRINFNVRQVNPSLTLLLPDEG